MQLMRRLIALLLRIPASLLMMGSFVLSRVTGLLRDLIVSYHFGTGAAIAAYNAAVTLTDLLYLVVIGGALGTAFIPLFSERWQQGGPPQAWRFLNAVISWAVVVLGIAAGLIWLAAPLLVPLLYGGQGFDEATLQLTVDLVRWFLLSPLLLGLGGLAAEVLKVRQHFLIPALVPSLYNLGIIGGALLAPWYGVFGLAAGVLVGAALYLIVQLPVLFHFGMRLKPTLTSERSAVRRVALLMGPRVLGQAAAHLSMVATLALAARLDDGDAKMAALRYASTLMMLPYGIFSLSLSSVAFSRMAVMVAAGQLDDVRTTIRTTLGMILWLTLPATAVLLVLGEPLARLLFERGAFDTRSLGYTASALLGYALALPAFAASEILVRSFYVFQRTWIPVLVGVLQVALNLSLGTLLIARGADLAAIAIAFAVANSLESIILLALLQRVLPGLWQQRALQRTLLGSLVVSALIGGLLLVARILSSGLVPGLWLTDAYQWPQGFLLPALWCAVVIALSGALYVAISRVLGLAPARELHQYLAPLLRRFRPR